MLNGIEKQLLLLAVKSQESLDKEQQLKIEKEKREKRDAINKLKMQQRAEVRGAQYNAPQWWT